MMRLFSCKVIYQPSGDKPLNCHTVLVVTDNKAMAEHMTRDAYAYGESHVVAIHTEEHSQTTTPGVFVSDYE